jgi:adenylate cyclase
MRRLSAILAADVVGYSRLMGEDEAGTLAALRAHRAEIFDPAIAERGGRLVKLMGDGALVEFSSVVDAVEAALVIQKRVAEDGGPIRLRIGVNLGDVIIDGDDIYGDGVNVAARLEALAEPGGICIASIVHESIGNRVETEFADAGEHEVKGVKRPIRVFRWPDAGTPSSAPGRTPNQPVRKTSIAVLPFDNISGDAA